VKLLIIAASSSKTSPLFKRSGEVLSMADLLEMRTIRTAKKPGTSRTISTLLIRENRN
jgi:hypothetical protein